MAEEVLEPAPTAIPDYYRTEFAHYSLGTEEELIDGPAVAIAKPVPGVDPKLIALVTHTETEEVLVEITQDLPRSTSGCMVELRTTPTELSDADWNNAEAWAQRRTALDFAINAVDAHELGRADRDFCRMEIRNPNHKFFDLSGRAHKTVQKTGRQATIGIPIWQLGVDPELDLGHGQVHKYLTLPWYRHQLASHAVVATTSIEPEEKIRFAIVLSATMKLAWLLDAYGRVGTGEAKDAWEVRPRTPPIDLFDEGSEERKVVQTALLDLKQWPGEPMHERAPTPRNWEIARGAIALGRPLGGTSLPGCEAKDVPAALFEYRRPELFPEAFTDAFWVPTP